MTVRYGRFRTHIQPEKMGPIMAIIPFSHQAGAYEELRTRAEIYFGGCWKQFKIRPRCHSLVVAPSGSGKTTLIQAVAHDCHAVCVRVSAPGWIPLAARENTAKETFPTILQTILENERTVVFVDEIDKLSHRVSWMEYVRGEIFDLLDGIIRPHLRIPGAPEESEEETLSERASRMAHRSNAERKLQESAFFVGAGTFQAMFDGGRPSASIGFGAPIETSDARITAALLSERLPRELVARFSGELVLLPEMTRNDYRHMIGMAAAALPDWLQTVFVECAEARLEAAIMARSGCRYMEETVLSALKLVKEPSAAQKNKSALKGVDSPEIIECNPNEEDSPPWVL